MYRTDVGEARKAHRDLRALLDAVVREQGLEMGQKAAETVRTATREGRLDGATYGSTSYSGEQVACVLGWVDVTVRGYVYFGDSPHGLNAMRDWDKDGHSVGSYVEDYVSGIERGDTPQTDHRAANIARWCGQWLRALAPSS